VSERQVDQETVAIVQSAEDECRNGYTRASLVGAPYVSSYKLTAASAASAVLHAAVVAWQWGMGRVGKVQQRAPGFQSKF